MANIPADIESIKKKINTEFSYWYHKINLGGGIITPGFDYEPLWNNIRAVRSNISYTGKRVLDIASFDGLWAFEAEQLGASSVVATDCLYRSFKNFLFCRDVLRSQCIPYYNVSPYNLYDRLDTYFAENYENEKQFDRMFDIVQHLGLLYHLRDPLLSLSQARSCIKTGGTLLIESNVVLDSNESFMLYNGIPFTYRASDNYSVWWIPTLNCLKEMLFASFFEPIESSVSVAEFSLPLQTTSHRFQKRSHGGYIEKPHKIGRVCMVARASEPSNFDPDFVREMNRFYRNPGLNLSHT
jgi:tRNA (mo5U34)-methyltransferase